MVLCLGEMMIMKLDLTLGLALAVLTGIGSLLVPLLFNFSIKDTQTSQCRILCFLLMGFGIAVAFILITLESWLIKDSSLSFSILLTTFALCKHYIFR